MLIYVLWYLLALIHNQPTKADFILYKRLYQYRQIVKEWEMPLEKVRMRSC